MENNTKKTAGSAKTTVIFLICSALLIAALCIYRNSNAEAGYEKYSETYFDYFDTVSTVAGYDESEEAFREKSEFVRSELERYNKLFDIYHTYEGMNNLCTVNREGAGKPVKVDGEIIDLLKFCKEVYDTTGGRTNIALGSVLNLWHEAREAAEYSPDKAYVPQKSELRKAAGHCNIEDIVIDEEASTVYLKDPEMTVDVGAVAKGYATEMIARELKTSGAEFYSLNIGGNIRAVGVKADGRPWVAAVQNPDLDSDKSYVAQVFVDGKALVTSGSYQRYFYVDGVKYHHIINPDTLMPEDMWDSVSILTADSGMGDALSTALFNMDYQSGLELIDSLPDTEAMWVDRQGKLYYTDGFRELLK